jgi:hypothetical protein
MAFGRDDDLDSGFRQNDGVGVDAEGCGSKLLMFPHDCNTALAYVNGVALYDHARAVDTE